MVIVQTDNQIASDILEGVPPSTVEEQESVLKKLGNVSRYKMNKECTNDQFDIGRAKLKNVIAKRQNLLIESTACLNSDQKESQFSTVA